jgi:hypothetical protein
MVITGFQVIAITEFPLCLYMLHDCLWPCFEYNDTAFEEA